MATIDDIISRAQQVRDNTIVGSNTAPLVGGVMTDTAEHLQVAESDINTLKTKVNTNTVKLNTTTQKAETALNLAEGLSEEGRYIIEGNVTNNPDEVTLTSEDDKLQIKNRRYLASVGGVQGQMGYIILAKGQTFKQQVETIREGNTIFEIRYDYDLGGGNVMIPENCTLKFDGGKISNGTLVGDGTEIVAGLVMIFNSVSVSGTWRIKTVYGDWFSDIKSDLSSVFKLCNNDIHNDVYISAGEYNVTLTSAEGTIAGVGVVVDSMDDITVYNNGTLILTPNGYPDYAMLRFKQCCNIDIVGGIYVGDREEHDYTTHQDDGYKTHQWGRCLQFSACDNIHVRNAVIKESTGDGINFGTGNTTSVNGVIEGVEIFNCRRQGITVAKVNNLLITRFYIHDILGTAPQAAIDVEPENNNVAENVTIDNGTIVNCGRAVLVWRGGSSTNYHKNIVVSNITIKDVEDTPTGMVVFGDCENVKCNNIYITNVNAADTHHDVGTAINNNDNRLCYIGMRNCKKAVIDTVYASTEDSIGAWTFATINCSNVNFKNINAKIQGAIVCYNSNYTGRDFYITDSDITAVNSLFYYAGNTNVDKCGIVAKNSTFAYTTFINTATNKPFDIEDCVLDGTFNLVLSNGKLQRSVISAFLDSEVAASNAIIKDNEINGLLQIRESSNLIVEGNKFGNDVRVTIKNNKNLVFRGNKFTYTLNDTGPVTITGAASATIESNSFNYTAETALSTTSKSMLYIGGDNVIVTRNRFIVGESLVQNIVYYPTSDNKVANYIITDNYIDGTLTTNNTDPFAMSSTHFYRSKGMSGNKPTLSARSDYAGAMYYDAGNKKYVMWNGTAWTNLDGTALS